MTMPMHSKKTKKQWYVIAYDIREPGRLRRVHYYMKKRAVALQKSVFLFKDDTNGLQQLFTGIKELVDEREDDIRLYPISHPHSIWAAGKQASALHNLFPGSGMQQPASSSGGFFKRLFQRKK